MNIVIRSVASSGCEQIRMAILFAKQILQKNLTFFSKNGPKKSFLSILTIWNNSEFRIRNSELLKNITKKVRIIFMPFKPIEELTFTDDFMFNAVMKNKEICIGLLERLLEIKIADIKYLEVQKSLKPYYNSKGVRLDVYVQGSDKIFDIEVQTYKPENLAKRMRYYQGIIDVDSLQRGTYYTELKQSFIIFICTFDPFGLNLPMYSFKNKCLQSDKLVLEDETLKVVFNTQSFNKENNLERKAILNYLYNNKASTDFTKKISTLVEDLKQSEKFKGEYMMINIRDYEIADRAKKEGIQQGAEQKAIETAKNLLTLNLSLEQIAQATSLPLEKIQDLQNQMRN